MIKAYTGKTGSGKTFLMVKEAWHYWLSGWDIYTNTPLDFDGLLTGKKHLPLWHKIYKKNRRYGRIIHFDNINDIVAIKDGLVLFDEAQVLFNARNWENLPDEFQYKLQQHRKHRIDLICTTQNMGTIDITYRRLVHEWIHCKNVLQVGNSPKILFGLFRAEYKDVDFLYNSVDDLQVPTLKSRLFIIHYFSPKLYNTMYDLGFKKFKVLWINNYDKTMKSKQIYLIIPKKMSLNNALRDIRLYQSLSNPRILRSSKKS